MRKIAKSLALIGFQSSGKTTLGKQLAAYLRCSFVDTDQLIEQFHPTLSCREIFQQFGSFYFRQLENQVIASLTYQPPLVVATGGGSLLQISNGLVLKAHSILIYLKTSPEILRHRIGLQSTLPGYLKGDNLEQAFANLYKERAVIYEKWADQMLEMDHLNEKESLRKLVQIAHSNHE
jgi:shikimate kinase